MDLARDPDVASPNPGLEGPSAAQARRPGEEQSSRRTAAGSRTADAVRARARGRRRRWEPRATASPHPQRATGTRRPSRLPGMRPGAPLRTQPPGSGHSHGSALGARRSALGARRSALGARALGARRSALGARRSALGARRSALGARRSALGARRSALGARRSALGARRSALGARHLYGKPERFANVNPVSCSAPTAIHSALLVTVAYMQDRHDLGPKILACRNRFVNNTALFVPMRYMYYARAVGGGEKLPADTGRNCLSDRHVRGARDTSVLLWPICICASKARPGPRLPTAAIAACASTAAAGPA